MENANPNNNQPQQQQQQHEDENMVLDEDGVELDIRTSPEVRSLYPYGDDVRQITEGVKADILSLVMALSPSTTTPPVKFATVLVSDYVNLESGKPHQTIFPCEVSYFSADKMRLGQPFVHIHRMEKPTDANFPQSFNEEEQDEDDNDEEAYHDTHNNGNNNGGGNAGGNAERLLTD